jgi:hypothetical protein
MGTWQEVTEYQNKTVEKPYLEGWGATVARLY